MPATREFCADHETPDQETWPIVLQKPDDVQGARFDGTSKPGGAFTDEHQREQTFDFHQPAATRRLVKTKHACILTIIAIACSDQKRSNKSLQIDSSMLPIVRGPWPSGFGPDSAWIKQMN